MNSNKSAIHDFWNEVSCRERLLLPEYTKEGFPQRSAIRYQLEPEIMILAEFQKWRGKNALEIGVGLGADRQQFAEHGTLLNGVDLTERQSRTPHVDFTFSILIRTSELPTQSNFPSTLTCFPSILLGRADVLTRHPESYR